MDTTSGVFDERQLEAEAVAELQRYLLERSLTLEDHGRDDWNKGVVRYGRTVLRGQECNVAVYTSIASPLLVLCARPLHRWTFGECFPELPSAETMKECFLGELPPDFRPPLLSSVAFERSTWVLISAAGQDLEAAKDVVQRLEKKLRERKLWEEKPREEKSPDREGEELPTQHLKPGLNIIGKPSFGDIWETCQGDQLLGELLPGGVPTVQANVEYSGGAPVLVLPIRLIGRELKLGKCSLTDLVLSFRAPMYYVRRAPALAVDAKLVIKDTTLAISAQYPLDDDLVEAQVTLKKGSPVPFVEAAKDLPLGADRASELNVTAAVVISKKDRKLVRARLEVSLGAKWSLLKNLLEVANPEFHLLVLDPAGDWRIAARIAGEVAIAGVTLRLTGDYAATKEGSNARFALSLDPRTPLSLTKLLRHLVGEEVASGSHAVPECEIDRLLFECDLKGHLLVETEVSVRWDLAVAGVTLALEQARFRYEREPDGDRSRFGVSAAVTIGELPLDVSGDRAADKGWSFAGAMRPGGELKVGALLRKVCKQLDYDVSPPRWLDKLTVRDLAVTFDADTFTFRIGTHVDVGGTTLDTSVAIRKNAKTARLDGTMEVGGATFELKLESDQGRDALHASWKEGHLELESLAPAVPGLARLQPKAATLDLTWDGDKERLEVSVAGDGLAASLRVAHDPEGSPQDTVAVVVKPGKVAASDLGPLGRALEPHDLVLDKLAIVAATAASEALDGCAVDKGLLLSGILKFEGTSFKESFECRLGGEEAKGSGSSKGTEAAPPAAPRSPEPEPQESAAPKPPKNNVRVGLRVGPVMFRKARFETRSQRVVLLLDASVGTGAFALDLTGLNLSFPVARLTEPKKLVKELAVGLDGLTIAYSNPPLAITGGFTRKAAEAGDHYAGALLVKASAFQITAIGQYDSDVVELDEEKKEKKEKKKTRRTSLFVYGTFQGVLGGPPAFCVTGLALGGGYNSRLELPPIEEVAGFSLIRAVTDAKLDVEEIKKSIHPSNGDNWLAAGVKFNSFQLADSFALFTASFGTRLQFGLLGLTKLLVPTGAPKEACAVYAELAIRAVLDPQGGVFCIDGRLTESSFIFSKEIRLTGGFAFFVWFGGSDHAGDFVISLGGYHPRFLPPSHYPVVPRVGISGQLGKLSFGGEAYLAITPSCLMCGLKLAAVFKSGRITAAFVAYADFVIAWAPFHYETGIGIGIAVTVRLWRCFKLEVGAELHVKGPPLAGTARVKLWIVSFTIEFGDQRGKPPAPLSWAQFQDAFLPAPDPKSTTARLCAVRITEGLVREVTDGTPGPGAGQGTTYRVFNAHELTIETDSVVPCTEVGLAGEHTFRSDVKLGIRPMSAAATELTSRHTISIAGGPRGERVEDRFRVVRSCTRSFPEALWAPTKSTGTPAAEMIHDVLSGAVLRVQSAPAEWLGPFSIEKFGEEPITKQIPWAQADARPASFDGDDAAALRASIREHLWKRRDGQRGWNELELPLDREAFCERFRAQPMIAPLA